MNMKYRLANESDIDSIVELRLKLNDHISKRDHVMVEKVDVLKNNIRKILQNELNKTIYFFLALDADKVVAGGGLILHTMLPSVHFIDGIKGYITGVYTDEDYRKRGIQKQIIKMLLDLSREQKCQKVELDSVNPHAIELYQSFGFQKVDNKYRIDINRKLEK